MLNKKSFKFIIGFAVIVLVAGAGFFWRDMKDYWQERKEREELNDFYSQVEKERQRRIEAYKNDSYGGETPEETWNMFIEALKKGDANLASKYFVVEKQEEWRKKFNAGIKSGAVDSFLHKDIPLIAGGEYYDDGKTFEFYTNSINNGPGFVYILTLNPYTNLWKIESL